MSDAGEPLYVGAVWSEGSWFAVAFDRDGFDHAAVFAEVGDLWVRYEETAERVLVDVPVGLVEEGEEGRRCDELAGRVLGPMSDAVVTPPVREATRKRRYPAAQRVNERKAGRGISERAFAMSDAIVAVDELLQNVPEAKAAFAESHPEVCFRALAGEPLEHGKDYAAGYAERMRTLAQHDRDAPPVVQAAAEATESHEVAVADVLDGVALAYTAAPGEGDLRTLPADPPTDAAGLPMAITYRADSPLVTE
jgi:predicted RNase H-like nuclease